MKLKVTNEQIILFIQNVDSIIASLSKQNKRNKYLAALQRMFDALEPTYKSIEKHQKAITEKHATVDSTESKAFVLAANGQFTYNKASLVEKDKELDEYHQKTREVTLDIPLFLLSERDLPHDDKGLSISNQMVKVLCPFVISKELRDKLLYGDLLGYTEEIVNEMDTLDTQAINEEGRV